MHNLKDNITIANIEFFGALQTIGNFAEHIISGINSFYEKSFLCLIFLPQNNNFSVPWKPEL